MQNITLIKKELKGCQELEYPYKCLLNNCYLKYITLKDNEELFYQGGNFIRMGFDKIILKNKGKTWGVHTVFRDADGNILYKTRFFIKNEIKECEKTNSELKKVVKNQQEIIEKMSHKLNSYEQEIMKYKTILQKYKLK